jgi:sugar O-acyltransferase (sialic acid O-acetyltransferase NeuD family)
MKLAVIGSAINGGAVQIIDILDSDKLCESIRVYDDAEEAQNTDVLGVPVVGPLERIMHDFHDKKIDSAVIAVGSINPRKKIFNQLTKSGIDMPNIISKRSIISNSCTIGFGNVILPLVYLGPKVTIGNNNYFTTSTVINHDSMVGSHCYFSTNVSIAGRVQIGNEVRLDAGSSIAADAVLTDCSLIGVGQSFGPVRGR